ncbi:aspergillopepsin-2 [Colletotrichum spaethianum]|uniref:Aspergillopepsin-2 n=1 Tax=Colletotrichum spaethianum TaxID=700344 RepID=A0AA37UKD4_9PEZI|nr:aspergillopepsin-2 [Colletotrichum spaethianum]GKT49846.1 aspergillopepsin-2 [Colletotrichum spaethianum]
MKFTVPKTLGPDVTMKETDYYAASVWVGIDGLTHGNALLQTGVTVEINKSISDEVAYVPWYEWWPNIAMKLDISIRGGDEVEVEVVMFNGTSGKILLWNKSRGEWVARTLQAPRPDSVLAGHSVEWIVEDFALSEGGNVPFGDFGIIELRDCKAHTSTDEVVGPDTNQPFYIRQNNMTRTSVALDGHSVSIEYLTEL